MRFGQAAHDRIMSDLDVDLRTTYLGLELRSPLVASAGPLTGDVDRIVDLERAGIGAVVLPSLFEEQIEHETNEVDRLLAINNDEYGWIDPSRPPFGIAQHPTDVDGYLQLIEGAKSRVDIPVIASLNGANIGGWLRHAHLLSDAGADAIELNLFAVGADPIVSCASLESEQFGLVALLADEVTVPLAVKISPFYSSLANFVVGLQEAGAAGVTLFNRFLLPELEPEATGVLPRAVLSTPNDLGLPLRWTSILRQHLAMSIALSSGAHNWYDVVKSIRAGADVVMMTSALMQHGVDHIVEVEAHLRSWMAQHGEPLSAVRGSLRHDATAAAAGFEYTFVGVMGSPVDVGGLAEYLWDSRGTIDPNSQQAVALRRFANGEGFSQQEAQDLQNLKSEGFSPFQNDLFVGSRIAFNDLAGSEILAGGIVDLESGRVQGNIEASRRFGPDWKGVLELRTFDAGDGSDPLYSLEDDDYISVELIRYF